MPEEVIYCEMCGKAMSPRDAKSVFVEGALLRVCSDCYSRLMRSGARLPSKPPSSLSRPTTARTSRSVKAPRVERRLSTPRPTRRQSLEKYELVEDFAERIRKARERLGWSTRMLAMKVKESETTIRRIESGKLRPTLELAKRLEEVLGIKLLVPAVEEELGLSSSERREYVTLGEIVSVREE